MELILASTSPYRRALLERLGLPFRCLPPGVDESGLPFKGITPVDLAIARADAKADAVARAEPHTVVIGSDQVATIDGLVLDKPGTPERAHTQLRKLSGRAHAIVTAVTIRLGARSARHCDRSTLTMRALDDAEIARYLAADAPWDCAGSYKLECRGITLFDRIESDDHTAIVGLPLLAVCAMLRAFGVAIP